MRIVQLLPTLVSGDAIGNDVVELDKILKEWGYDTQIYAQNVGRGIDPCMVGRGECYLQQIKPEDIVIYHLSTGTTINDKLKQLQCKLIIDYHNITPPTFKFILNSHKIKLTFGLQFYEF